jgi:hypothetical protein
MLELAAASGEIDLKYLDESGFCVWSEPGYTYYFRGEQKRLEQTKHRGRRLSIIGFLQPLISFVYGLVIGGISRKSYIEMMEIEANEAQKTGRTRVIVQDNGSIHIICNYNNHKNLVIRLCDTPGCGTWVISLANSDRNFQPINTMAIIAKVLG